MTPASPARRKKCLHGIEEVWCGICNPPPPYWPDASRYSLIPTLWGREVRLDGKPIYSFPFDMHFRLSRADARLAVACARQLEKFARGGRIEEPLFEGYGYTGVIYEPGDFHKPYVSIEELSCSAPALRLGRHKAWAVVALKEQLNKWVVPQS